MVVSAGASLGSAKRGAIRGGGGINRVGIGSGGQSNIAGAEAGVVGASFKRAAGVIYFNA